MLGEALSKAGLWLLYPPTTLNLMRRKRDVRLDVTRDHAIAILKKDHDTVKALFEEFEKAETPARKTKIIDQALTELKIHAILEEEIFYPTVRAHVGRDIMNEADEEHHVAKVLIAELDTVDAKNDHRDAKFTVLAESVRHTSGKKKPRCCPRPKNSISISRLSDSGCSPARKSC